MTKNTATLSLILPLLAFCLFGNLDTPSNSILSTWFISSFSITKVGAILGAWIISMALIYSVNDLCLKKTGRSFLIKGLIGSATIFAIAGLSYLTGNTVKGLSLDQIATFSVNTGFLLASACIAMKSVCKLSH